MTNDAGAIFAPYGMIANLAYTTATPLRGREIVLEVREGPESLRVQSDPDLKLLPDAYRAQALLTKQGMVITVSGEGITMALKHPERFTQWARKVFAFLAEATAPHLTRWEEYETVHGVGHRDVPDRERTLRAVPGDSPAARKLLKARSNQRVVQKGSGRVGDGSDQGVFL